MVGVKTWEDDQIALILACKAEGKKVPEIISELKKRWPRKQIRDSGVRYVITNYKEIPENRTMAGVSKPRSSQGLGSHACQKRAHPKETNQAKSTARPVPKNVKLRTKQSQSPASPQINYAARIREISRGPPEATFSAPQPFKVLKDRVQSTTRLLTQARQAQDIGIDAINFCAEVPAPPADEPGMAFPAPHRHATEPEARVMHVGRFGQHDLQHTVSMPPMYGTGNRFGAMGPQDMRMIGHQNPHIGSMNMAPTRQPSVRGHYPQVRGNGQHTGLYQGHFEEIGSNIGANLGGNMATPQRIYQDSLNYGTGGAMGGMMPGNVHFGQLYRGQFANPVHHGQYHPAASPMQHTNPAMVKFDPPLDPRLFNDIPMMSTQQAANAMSNAGAPSRTRVAAIPQTNHHPQLMTQESQDGPIGTLRTNLPANWVAPENLSGASTNLPPNHPTISTPREAQNGMADPPRPSRPTSAVAQELQNGKTATPQLNHPASPTAQQPRNGTSATPETNNTSISTAGKIIITLTNPRFDEPFNFPSSKDGWSLFLKDYTKAVGKDQLVPADSLARAFKGDFEVHFINPSFRKGIVWDSTQKTSRESKSQIKSPPPDVKMDIDAPAASKPSEGLGLSQSLGPSMQTNEVALPPTAREAQKAATGPAQAEITLEPKTPSTKAPPFQVMEKTPSMSPLQLTGHEENSPEVIRMPIQRPPIGVRNPNLGPQGKTKLSPQISDSHSKEFHNKQSTKRTAPTGEREVSPSKRQKSAHQDNQQTGGTSILLSRTGMGPNNPESMKCATSSSIHPGTANQITQTSAELPSFATAVAQLPNLSPSQLLLPAEDKSNHQLQLQTQVPALAFAPRPSQPLSNSDLFQAQSPHQQYSAAIVKLVADRLDEIPLHSFINIPNRNGLASYTLPLMYDGLDVQRPQQQKQQNHVSENAANNQQEQQEQQENEVLDFGFDANFAANSQYQLEDPEFNFSFNFGDTNENSDLNQILGLDIEMNGNPSPSPSPLPFGASKANTNPDKGSDYNASSRPETPVQPPLSPSLAFAAFQLGIDDDAVRALSPIERLAPWRPAENASLQAQMTDDYERTREDFKDILDLKGVNDPARKGGAGVTTG